MGVVNASGDTLWAEQGPGERLDYAIDWKNFLGVTDTIVTSTITADTGITVDGQTYLGSIAQFWVSGGVVNTWYTITNSVTTSLGRTAVRSILFFIKAEASALPPVGSALFPNRFTATAKLRQDRLLMMARSLGSDLNPTDDYLWEKLLSAEAQAGNMLRVPFQPTHFFPVPPTADQLAALPVGMPWEIDQAYDYDPANYRGDRWGYIVLRQKPVISIVKARMLYPSPQHVVLDIPPDWLRLDRKYGHVQMVPTSSPFLSPIGGLVMNSMAGGRLLPFSIEIEFIAGLENIGVNHPDLIDVVQKMAITKVVEDMFFPASGSISADGLSQSLSVDVSKYHDAIDRMMNGADGNGGLVARINGIRTMVI